MPIRFPQPPDAIAAAADDVAGPQRRDLGTFANELGGTPALAPQPVFTAGLDSLVANAGDVERVADAPTSWRYGSELGGAGPALEFSIEGFAQEPRALRFGDDQFTPAIHEALAIAEDDPRVAAGDFEGRLLRVPALKLLAVWLHATETDDLFVPVTPAAVDAAPGRVHEAATFQARLEKAAAETLALYESAERPDELGG